MSSQELRLYLAPMEGVVDSIMRDQLTSIGGIDRCVTEFIRVTSQLLPDSVYFRDCPELSNSCKTNSGVPVLIQLLGSDPGALAENAAKACELGAPGIDLNFGCPAKTVNRHHGGASVLRHPELLKDIVKSVRAAVPKNKTVSAKIRLGFDNPEDCLRNAALITDGGADWITVHCRTKTNGYVPPAYWEWIPKIRENTHLPIVANGEIWNSQDLTRCQEITGCSEFMIGRGAIANPYIFAELKNLSVNSDWDSHLEMLIEFFKVCETTRNKAFASSRCKQWLRQWQRYFPQAEILFEKIKALEPSAFGDFLSAQAPGSDQMASSPLHLSAMTSLKHPDPLSPAESIGP